MAAGEGAESILGHCGGIAQRARSEADAPGRPRDYGAFLEAERGP
jgi:hypothetical protein